MSVTYRFTEDQLNRVIQSSITAALAAQKGKHTVNWTVIRFGGQVRVTRLS